MAAGYDDDDDDDDDDDEDDEKKKKRQGPSSKTSHDSSIDAVILLFMNSYPYNLTSIVLVGSLEFFNESVVTLEGCHGIESRHAAKHEKRPSQKLETSWPFSFDDYDDDEDEDKDKDKDKDKDNDDDYDEEIRLCVSYDTTKANSDLHIAFNGTQGGPT
ncbi:hypothetical protein M0804_001055 [Polistes exclamans]|nr:hypothetical protein M0804_001055 [Polistes exclamans]